jgi:hypothetical protein
MTKSTWAKVIAGLGGVLSTFSSAGIFNPKWTVIVTSASGALVALSAAIASSTSAGHPDGASSTVLQTTPLKGVYMGANPIPNVVQPSAVQKPIPWWVTMSINTGIAAIHMALRTPQYAATLQEVMYELRDAINLTYGPEQP